METKEHLPWNEQKVHIKKWLFFNDLIHNNKNNATFETKYVSKRKSINR